MDSLCCLCLALSALLILWDEWGALLIPHCCASTLLLVVCTSCVLQNSLSCPAALKGRCLGFAVKCGALRGACMHNMTG